MKTLTTLLLLLSLTACLGPQENVAGHDVRYSESLSKEITDRLEGTIFNPEYQQVRGYYKEGIPPYVAEVITNTGGLGIQFKVVTGYVDPRAPIGPHLLAKEAFLGAVADSIVQETRKKVPKEFWGEVTE